MFTQGLRWFTQSLRAVYAEFTQRLRNVMQSLRRFMHGLRKVYAV